jgi:prolyl-tRNA synthetase
MRVTHLFTKTSKTAPADEVAKNAQLLIRAGYVHKEMAGVYAYLPLGIRVLDNIRQIVREEMDAIGGQELIMTGLQRKELWETTKRWDDEVVDIWFKSKLKDGTDVGFGWSHEEPIVEMLKRYVESYKDMPVAVYQFQTKLRNELRAKSGIMRGREFIMKDMYSCNVSPEAHEEFYQACIEAYKRVYDRLGIGADTYITFASGGAFTEFSHEFQTICDAGEDIIYLHREKNIALNEEVLDDENLAKVGLKREELEKVKTAEVGNIFNFGTSKSDGIGITRLMGVIAEKFSDEKGLVWPDNIAPYRVYLARLGNEEQVVAAADRLYDDLEAAGITVLYDDRDARPGEKFADADLLGMPHRIVVSAKTVDQGKVEYKKRTEDESSMVDAENLKKVLTV